MTLMDRAQSVREATMRGAVNARNLVRRLAVAASAGGRWQLLGSDGEVFADVEAFQGIGYASRPADGAGEVILLRVSGNHPVIVATRDESIRVDLDEDETAIFNSSSIVKVKADGAIEIGSQGGSFAALATKDDIDALESWASTHVHVETGTTTNAPTIGPPSATGTTKLKAE